MNRRSFLTSIATIGVAAIVPVTMVPCDVGAGVVVVNETFVPELWAKEGLKIFEENMVVSSLIHHDFTREISI